VKEILAPTLEDGDVLVLDNLSVHKVKGVLDPLLEKGVKVWFLPPYNPDFNPTLMVPPLMRFPVMLIVLIC
jgi:transposase